MTYKYYRSMPPISRDNGAIDRGEPTPAWLSEFTNNLEKEAVKSKQEDYSLYDQINSILGNKSKYSTVQEAVEDMKKRTGLSLYLDQLKATAQAQTSLFEQIPELRTFIDNYVKARPGTSIDAVIHDLLKIKSIQNKLPKSDDVPDEIKRYINDQIASARDSSPASHSGENLQLGKVDLSVDDDLTNENNPFRGCEPTRK
jgi:hypothetical protein